MSCHSKYNGEVTSHSGMKHCNGCNQDLPRERFGRKTSSHDGLKSRCKDCVKAYNAANRERDRAKERERDAKNPEQKRARYNRWYGKNRDDYLAIRRDRYAADPESHRARQRAYYAQNAEARRAYTRQYIENNPGYQSVKDARRNAARYGAVGSFSIDEWLALVAFYDDRCLRCGVSEVTVDHVRPLSKGGTNWITNIQPLCKHCNCTKSDKEIDYRPEFGRPDSASRAEG